VPDTHIQKQINFGLSDGSSKEQKAMNDTFGADTNGHKKFSAFKCLDHGKCDLFLGIKDSLDFARKQNKYDLVMYDKGALHAIFVFIKLFGGNTKYEYNRKLSMQSFLNNLDESFINNKLFNSFKAYPKTREKDILSMILSTIYTMFATYRY
jgi:hypothetical protein